MTDQLKLGDEIYILCEKGIRIAWVVKKETTEYLDKRFIGSKIIRNSNYWVSGNKDNYGYDAFQIENSMVWARTKEELLEKL